MLSRPPASFAASTSCCDRLLEGERCARQSRQGVAVEFIRESVTAEQESVALQRVDRHHVDRDGVLDADAARQLVTSWVHRRLFRGESTHSDPLLGDAVVVGQLAKCAVAQLVGPRVAHVTERG